MVTGGAVGAVVWADDGDRDAVGGVIDKRGGADSEAGTVVDEVV